ncbi:mitochondrial Rho GTPase 1-like [Corylus avellana]|uniref:mitochondrial Rho GTPase 1-like n=1 Tax=Corylus avellana TaxID=13451 RepID=UPI00286CB28C|nr:mitochondrial Rho GTPase 1-like [Corylus avellana]
MEGMVLWCGWDEMALFAVLARKIWHRCNGVFHGEDFIHPNRLIIEAEENQCLFLVAHASPVQINTNSSRVKWQAPPFGRYKVNWDIAIGSDQNRMGIGVLVCDHHGLVHASLCKTLLVLSEPACAKAMGALATAKFSKDLGVQDIILEGDCLQVVKTIKSSDPCWSHYGQTMGDARMVLNTRRNRMIYHVKREANARAHGLAKAASFLYIREVFYYAQKAVLHPAGLLFDQETQTLMRPRFVRALKRIFFLCDHDRDGALNDAELNDFQVKFFNAPLQPSEIVGVKRVVSEKLREGVHERGLTWTGFLFLHALHIEKGRLETTWTILRKFGYNNYIKLAGDVIPSTSKRAPDQTVELTNEATEYLREIFGLYSTNPGTKKTLVLRDIPEDRVSKLLSDKESLAPCDVAVFVHDSSNRATELLVEVASHGEDTGFEVPCLVVAAKEDLDSFSMATHNSNREIIGQTSLLNGEVPKLGQGLSGHGNSGSQPISTKSGNLDNIFCRIVSAAEHPHMRIPKAKTEAGRSRKQYRLINHSLMVFSVGAAVAIVGLVLWRQGIMLPVKGS